MFLFKKCFNFLPCKIESGPLSSFTVLGKPCFFLSLAFGILREKNQKIAGKNFDKFCQSFEANNKALWTKKIKSVALPSYLLKGII